MISRHKFHYFASLPSISLSFFFFLFGFFLFPGMSHNLQVKQTLQPSDCTKVPATSEQLLLLLLFFPILQMPVRSQYIVGVCNSRFLFARVLHSSAQSSNGYRLHKSGSDFAPGSFHLLSLVQKLVNTGSFSKRIFTNECTSCRPSKQKKNSACTTSFNLLCWLSLLFLT